MRRNKKDCPFDFLLQVAWNASLARQRHCSASNYSVSLLNVGLKFVMPIREMRANRHFRARIFASPMEWLSLVGCLEDLACSTTSRLHRKSSNGVDRRDVACSADVREARTIKNSRYCVLVSWRYLNVALERVASNTLFFTCERSTEGAVGVQCVTKLIAQYLIHGWALASRARSVKWYSSASCGVWQGRSESAAKVFSERHSFSNFASASLRKGFFGALFSLCFPASLLIF